MGDAFSQDAFQIFGGRAASLARQALHRRKNSEIFSRLKVFSTSIICSLSAAKRNMRDASNQEGASIRRRIYATPFESRALIDG
jgi:hypothetical protein